VLVGNHLMDKLKSLAQNGKELKSQIPSTKFQIITNDQITNDPNL
jgi:hypothetical protein